jgi:hypothetical protein
MTEYEIQRGLYEVFHNWIKAEYLEINFWICTKITWFNFAVALFAS